MCIRDRLKGPETTFLPFNQGSAGAGKDGGAGNPKSTDGSYVTSYFWEKVLQKDSLLDILQKFINYERTEKKETLPDGSTKKTVSSKVIFPRYHLSLIHICNNDTYNFPFCLTKQAIHDILIAYILQMSG